MSEFEEVFGEWGRNLDGTPKPLSVRTFTGSGQTGEKYASAADHAGLPQFDQSRLVRSADGNEVLSTAAVYAPLTLAGAFALHSLVTLASGREAAVLAVAVNDHEGLFSFVAVNLE